MSLVTIELVSVWLVFSGQEKLAAGSPLLKQPPSVVPFVQETKSILSTFSYVFLEVCGVSLLSTVHLWPFWSCVISFAAAATILTHIRYIILLLQVWLGVTATPHLNFTFSNVYHFLTLLLEFWLVGFVLFCGILCFTDNSLLLYPSHKWKYLIELDQEKIPVDAHWIIPKCESNWWITFCG